VPFFGPAAWIDFVAVGAGFYLSSAWLCGHHRVSFQQVAIREMFRSAGGCVNGFRRAV